MRLDVDAHAYTDAADALLGGNSMVAGAYSTLTSRLSGYAAMGGDDTSSEEFVAGYDSSAKATVAAIADLATAFGTLAVVTDTSGRNHKTANTRSVYRGGGADPGGVGADVAPRQVTASTPPSALGGDAGDAPEFWDMIVDHLQGWAWPSADTSRLREAASTWRSMGTTLDRGPTQCTVASSLLAGQRSPEIDAATAAIDDVSTASADLATACRDLADCCDQYAEKVDTTKEVVKGLLKDLAIEIAATAVVGGITSFFTFGGGAAVGAAVAASRIVSCARRVIEALRGIRAIRAIMKVAEIADKATDVGFLLRRFRTGRKIPLHTPGVPHRPTGHLPDTGTPNTYGYDVNGARLPYANSRPGYAPGQVDEVWRNMLDDNGEVWVLNKDDELVKIDWTPGQAGPRPWDMGHVPGEEYRDLRDDYLSGNISKDEFLQRYRDSDNYTVTDPGRNRSHMDEAPRSN